MPLNRSESSHKLTSQEGKILLDLSDLKEGRIQSLRAAARRCKIPESTVRTRASGTQSRVDQRPNRHKLIQLEESLFTEWTISIDMCRTVSRPSPVRDMANTPLAAYGNQLPATVGENWPLIFVNGRPGLHTRSSRRYNYQKALNEDPNLLRQWFATVQYIIDEKNIQPENIYNLIRLVLQWI